MAQAALVCIHIRSGGKPVLSVFHNRPVRPEDSGFCLSCGAEDHGEGEWRIIRDDLAFEGDPTLAQVRQELTRPGLMAERSAPDQPWVVERFQEAA